MPRVLIFGYKPKDYFSPRSKEKVDVIISRNYLDAKRRISYESFVMVIIDLENNETNGIGLADLIRKTPMQRATPIIFISNNRKKEHIAFHTFHCYDYFIKPLSSQDVLKILCLCYFRIDDEKWGNSAVLQIGTEKVPIRIDDILFIEKISRRTIVHTLTDEIYVPSLSLTAFQNEHALEFIRIHRGIIVNRNHIRRFVPSKALILLDTSDRELYIGKTFLREVRDLFD